MTGHVRQTELYPAIDLLDGSCVRLAQGDYDRKTVYSADPHEVVQGFIDAGTLWVHIVDLNAARGDAVGNRAVISKLTELASSASVHIETGGGVRTVADAAALFQAGVSRVIVGTAAVKRPEVMAEMVSIGGGEVAVGLDAHWRDDMWNVAVQGWTEVSGQSLFEVLAQAVDHGAHAVIATDIARDGMLTGPATQLYRDLLQFSTERTDSRLAVIASGGVAGPHDVLELAQLEGLAGVIAGRAIYEGRLNVADAVRLCRLPLRKESQ